MSEATDRYQEYAENPEFDRLILLIKRGTIKCGRYAHRVKLDPKFRIKKKGEYFNDTDNDSGK